MGSAETVIQTWLKRLYAAITGTRSPRDAKLEEAAPHETPGAPETAKGASGLNTAERPETSEGAMTQNPDARPETSEGITQQGSSAAVSASEGLTSRRRYRRSYRLQLNLAQRPLFCCGCIGLGIEDTRRLRRVLALTRAVVRNWR
jgi:hypothetical protein